MDTITIRDNKTTGPVSEHGERVGRADYNDRRDDVAAGCQPADWAWPFSGADTAYINARGTTAICNEIGEGVVWDEIASEWLDAFERGYRAARLAGIAESGTVQWHVLTVGEAFQALRWLAKVWS